jgi:hypothetical protein
VSWLAIAEAVVGGPCSDALCKALLAVIHYVVDQMTVLHIMRVYLMNGALCPLGRCSHGSHRDIELDLLVE